MSFYHENIVWQSQDGTWNVGFFERIHLGSYGDADYDAEWDDDYDPDRFQFVSTGHATAADAQDAWKGPNPGGFDQLSYSDDSASWIEKYENMAATMYETEGASQPTFYGGKGESGYYGPPRHRTLKAIKQERDAIVESWAHYQLGGYANQIDRQRMKSLDKSIDTMLPEATPQQREVFEDLDARHREALQDRIRGATQRNSRQNLVSFGARPLGNARAIDAVTEQIKQSERAAKQRTKQSRKATSGAQPVPKRAAQRRPKRAAGICGKPTRTGQPCQRSTNCPVH